MKIILVLLLLLVLRLENGEARPVQSRAKGHGLASTAASLCKDTPYPQVCNHILAGTSSTMPLNSQIAAVSTYALHLTSSTYAAALREIRVPPRRPTSKYTSLALQDCLDLMKSSMDQLKLSINRVLQLPVTAGPALHAQLMDAQVSLSASFTFQDTCSDELSARRRTTSRSTPPSSSAAAALLVQQGTAITQSIAVAMALADTLQHHIAH